MFRLPDNTLAILDNKTAKFTEHADELMPIYKVQLSVYRWLALKLNLGETSVTGLIYYEPDTHGASVDKVTETGFSMSFTAHILPIQTNLEQVESLLKEAQRISQLPEPPKGLHKCKDCEVIEHIRMMY
jgi:hypothetical protein